MARNLFRRTKAVPVEPAADVAGSVGWLSRPMGWGDDEPDPAPARKRHWWSFLNRGTSTMMINQPGNIGGTGYMGS